MASKTSDAIWSIPDGEMRSSLQTVRPSANRIPWGIASAKAVEQIPIKRGRNIRVGILDTGIDAQHPDLKGLVVRAVDFTNSRTGPLDVNGHATHVAGTIAANRGDGSGLIGMAPNVDLYCYKVLNDDGFGTDRQITAGLKKAIEDECDVVNVSLGGPSPMEEFAALMAEAKSKGIVIVCASGNGGNANPNMIFPARYVEAVAVGSHDRSDKVSNFSQGGRNLNLLAPGSGIESCFPGGRYTVMSGTSMATPHVTGAVAIIQRRLMVGSMRPAWEKTVSELMQCTRGEFGGDKLYGNGLLNLIPKYTTDPDPLDTPTDPDPDNPGQMIVEISLRGLSYELDAAFEAGKVTAAKLVFAVPNR